MPNKKGVQHVFGFSLLKPFGGDADIYVLNLSLLTTGFLFLINFSTSL